jgi:hypothetical protein
VAFSAFLIFHIPPLCPWYFYASGPNTSIMAAKIIAEMEKSMDDNHKQTDKFLKLGAPFDGSQLEGLVERYKEETRKVLKELSDAVRLRGAQNVSPAP